MVKRNKKKRRQSRAVFWFILSFLVAVFLVAWWIWPGLYKESPRLHYILLEKNGEFIKVLRGEVLRVHPQDRLKIARIATSITFNIGVRLTAAEIDIEALTYEALPIASLLPREALYRSNSLRVFVKHNNREVGHVDLVVEPFVEDWLERAARAIDPALRLSVLEEASAFAPEDEQVRGMLLQEYKAQEKWDKAAAMIEETLRQQPNEKLLREVFDVYEAKADTAGMLSALRRLIQEKPRDAALRLNLAGLLEKARRPQEAIREYEASLELVQDKLPLYKTIGYLYTHTNALQKAISAYSKALELDPKDVNLYYNLATLHEKLGEKDKADQFLLQAVRLKPDDINNRLNLAQALLERGNLEESAKLLKEVLEKDPKSVKGLLLMVALLDKQGDRKTLKDAYEKLLDLDPGNETVLYNLGVLEYEMGQWAKSLSYFERYVKAHPEDGEVRALLFDLYKKAKRDDQAFQEAKTLITLKPSDPAPYRFAFEYCHSRQDYQAVIPLLEKGVKALPGDAGIRQFLVLALLRTGKEESAMEQLAVLAKEKPRDVGVLLQLARLQEKKGRAEEALQSYERILGVSPGYKEAAEAQLSLLLQQARSEERQGKIKEALSLYEKILGISPGHEEAAEAYLRLRIQRLQ